MSARLTTKMSRTLMAAAAMLVLGCGLVWFSKPFVQPDKSNASLDSAPPIYMDAEAERSARWRPSVSDGELEDRANRPIDHRVTIQSGDTLKDVLVRGGLDGATAFAAQEAVSPVLNLRTLKTGQRVTLTFGKSDHGFGEGDFQQFSLYSDPLREVGVRRGENGALVSFESKRQVTRQIAHQSGVIKSSLYVSAQAAGIPTPIIFAMIKALSYDVDFQRDIQSGDSFDVLYDAHYDMRGKLVRAGEMLYASVTLSGKLIAMYRHDPEGGSVEYFNEKGESVKKALLKTPVDGAKITSGFGMRNHPILGYSKMHKGIDFGVPTGTPIQAAGDGTVEIAEFNASYGNYVRLRHGNGYSTAYAHMSRIAQGISGGRRVSQGQIVGYVGSTGRSTGPHLHYEVLVNGGQINPLSVKMPNNVRLGGRELERFKATRAETDKLLAKVTPGQRIGSNHKG